MGLAVATFEEPEDRLKVLTRIGTVTVMRRLKQVVSRDDPSSLYDNIKDIGQRYVSLRPVNICWPIC